MNNPLSPTIGVTGGIGAGKSTVCRIFKALGIPVYDADSRAKWLMANHEGLKQAITEAFGQESYTPEGHLNREYLAQTVFNASDSVAQLNALVHPKVGEDFKAWHAAQIAPYVIKEAALMVESGSYKSLDKLIHVSAPTAVRIHRVLLRDPQRSKEQVEAIIAKQLPEEKRKEVADYEVTNDEKAMVLPKVLRLHQKFLKLASAGNPQ